MKGICPSIYFCSDRLTLTWGDIDWGIAHEVVSLQDARKFAYIREGSPAPLAEIENAMLEMRSFDAWEMERLVRQAAALDPPMGILEERWRFLLLSWVYEKKESFDYPLGLASDIYADFGYPPDMEDFIHWRSSVDGWDSAKHGPEENERRLFVKWREYLDRTQKSLNSSNSAPELGAGGDQA